MIFVFSVAKYQQFICIHEQNKYIIVISHVNKRDITDNVKNIKGNDYQQVNVLQFSANVNFIRNLILLSTYTSI